MIPVYFEVTCLKVKVKPLFSDQGVVRSISVDPFTWSIPNLVQGLPLMSRWSLLIFRTYFQRLTPNYSYQPTLLSAQYLLTPSLDQYQTWCKCCPQLVDAPFWFWGHMFKGQGQPLFSDQCVVHSISVDPFTWSIPNLVLGLPSMSKWSLFILRSHV